MYLLKFDSFCGAEFIRGCFTLHSATADVATFDFFPVGTSLPTSGPGAYSWVNRVEDTVTAFIGSTEALNQSALSALGSTIGQYWPDNVFVFRAVQTGARSFCYTYNVALYRLVLINLLGLTPSEADAEIALAKAGGYFIQAYDSSDNELPADAIRYEATFAYPASAYGGKEQCMPCHYLPPALPNDVLNFYSNNADDAGNGFGFFPGRYPLALFDKDGAVQYTHTGYWYPLCRYDKAWVNLEIPAEAAGCLFPGVYERLLPNQVDIDYAAGGRWTNVENVGLFPTSPDHTQTVEVEAGAGWDGCDTGRYVTQGTGSGQAIAISLAWRATGENNNSDLFAECFVEVVGEAGLDAGTRLAIAVSGTQVIGASVSRVEKWEQGVSQTGKWYVLRTEFSTNGTADNSLQNLQLVSESGGALGNGQPVIIRTSAWRIGSREPEQRTLCGQGIEIKCSPCYLTQVTSQPQEDTSTYPCLPITGPQVFRMPARLDRGSNRWEESIYRQSNGKQVRTSAIGSRLYQLEVGYLDEQRHDMLDIALRNDAVTLQPWDQQTPTAVVIDGEYKVDWSSAPQRLPIAKGSANLLKQEYDVENRNCGYRCGY